MKISQNKKAMGWIAGIFFFIILYGFRGIALIGLFFGGIIYFCVKHLYEEKAKPEGEWVMHWDIFWQNIMLYGFLAFIIFLFTGEYDISGWHWTALLSFILFLLFSLIYSIIMAYSREISYVQIEEVNDKL